MSDFDNILDRSGSELSDEVVLYPNGTYQVRCAGVAFGSYTPKDSSDEVQTASLGFAIGQPTDDVDPDEYQSVAEQVQGQRVWQRFTLDNSKNIAAFKRALRSLGIEPNDPQYASLREAAKAAKGQEALGYIGIKTYKNRAGELIRDNEVKSLTSVASLSDAA